MELEASAEDGEAGLLGDWQAVQRACHEAEVAGGRQRPFRVPHLCPCSWVNGESWDQPRQMGTKVTG